jgi:hypothetical protein
MPRSRFHVIHESQAYLFRDVESRSLFTKYYDVATSEHFTTGIEDYTGEILKYCETINARNSPPSPPYRRSLSNDLFFTEGDNNADREEEERRKRMRRALSPTTVSSMSSDQPTIDNLIPIKTEDEESMQSTVKDTPKKELVIIYVGRNSQEHQIPVDDLAKSPILSSWVNNSEERQPFIMHPNLRNVNNQHFASLIRFMHNGEYLPATADIPTGFDENTHATAQKGLTGLRTSDQYSKELVRAGYLYRLAEQFEIEGLPEYIHKRVTQYAFRDYTHESMLNFARIIFTRPAVTTDVSSAAGTDHETASIGKKLEDWVLCWLAYQYQPVAREHSALFFNVVGVTAKSKFFQRLLRTKADQVDNLGGEPDYVDD